MTCVFCQIIRGELPATVIYETDDWLVIADINPQAAVHVLIITKEHFASFRNLGNEQHYLMTSLMEVVQEVTEIVAADSYRLLTNSGREAGQTVMHLHWHLLAGSLKESSLASEMR